MNLFSLRIASLALIPRIELATSFALRSLPCFRRQFLSSVTPQRQVSASSSEVTEEDILRWEKMYAAGGTMSTSLQEDTTGRSSVKSEIRVVSFDLDNTIWNTTTTIDAANEALAYFLNSNNISQPMRVEKVMGELFREDKTRYCPLEKEAAKAPVSLTLLRKEAIRKILVEHNCFTVEKADEFAEEAFAEWTRARHEAIPLHFASSVETCLREIAEIRTKKGLPVLIGAITDGNSDPNRIEALAGFFDFCINAESIGVGKPDKRLFLKGVERAVAHPSLSDLVPDDVTSISDDFLEGVLGSYWVHIGDDFAKDIVAAKTLNMRTIWCRELVMDKNPNTQKLEENKNSRSVEEFVKEMSGMKVVKMELGADDYLAQGLQQEFADATVDRFSDVSKILRKWQSEALDTALPIESSTIKGGSEINGLRPVSAEVAATPNEGKKKFCMFCGGSLPAVAKFCPHCGEKQAV